MDAMGELSQSGREKKRFHIGGQQAKLSLSFPSPFTKRKERKVESGTSSASRVDVFDAEQALTNPRKKTPRAKKKTLWTSPGSLSSEETEREKIAPARFEISLASMSGALYDAQLVLKKPLASLAHPRDRAAREAGSDELGYSKLQILYQPTWVVVVWERRIKFTWTWTAINFPEPFFLLACLRLSCPYMSLIVTPGYLAVVQEVRKPSCLLRIM